MLTLTAFAVLKVKEFSAKEEIDKPLRIFVKPGGCSGFEYGFSFDAQRDDDEVLEFDGLTVVVDPSSQLYLKGAEIDYVETTLQGGFVVTANPNEAGRCGCGESFNV